MKKRVVYGVANYEELVQKNGYFVDKTAYIEKLEAIENLVFLRPRRFGKSLWCRILECYYNINQQADFAKLFGHTYIGQHPTPLRNSCFVLHLDFSTVDPTGPIERIEESFNTVCNLKIRGVVTKNKSYFHEHVPINIQGLASSNLEMLLNFIYDNGLPPLYVIIDEYDNFANQLIVHHKDRLYYDLTREDSFLKTFFKTLKEGRKTGAIANVFITGVLPIVIDDLASGFNIANIITLDPDFEEMLGFTQAEVDRLLDDIYQDYELNPANRSEVADIIRNQYNGYHFITTDSEALYNPEACMYFLSQLGESQKIPEHVTDRNGKTDLPWLLWFSGLHAPDLEACLERLMRQNTMPYSNRLLFQFRMSPSLEKHFYPIFLYYLGILTKQDEFLLKVPNPSIGQIVLEYVQKLHPGIRGEAP